MDYEIIAIIIGPLVAVFTVYLEYKKDLKIKLEDRKQFWLKKHYNYIQTSIINIVRNIHIKNSMIYNGASQLSIGLEYTDDIPNINISNNLKPLMEGELKSHLQFYPFYNDAMELYDTVDSYNNDMINLYNNFIDYVQNTVSKHFKGIKPVDNIPSYCEGYYMEQIFRGIIYYLFNESDFKISSSISQDHLKYFSFSYKNNGSYYGLFFSRNENNVREFGESIMGDIISKFKDKFINMEKRSREIDIRLGNLIHELKNFTSDYNSGISIKGECENCKLIKDITKLDELMPPN